MEQNERANTGLHSRYRTTGQHLLCLWVLMRSTCTFFDSMRHNLHHLQALNVLQITLRASTAAFQNLLSLGHSQNMWVLLVMCSTVCTAGATMHWSHFICYFCCSVKSNHFHLNFFQVFVFVTRCASELLSNQGSVDESLFISALCHMLGLSFIYLPFLLSLYTWVFILLGKEAVFLGYMASWVALHFDLSCSAGCSCSPHGSLSDVCDLVSGQCPCRPHFHGRTCDVCSKGFWKPVLSNGCEPCGCEPSGSNSDTCDQVGSAAWPPNKTWSPAQSGEENRTLVLTEPGRTQLTEPTLKLWNKSNCTSVLTTTLYYISHLAVSVI